MAGERARPVRRLIAGSAVVAILASVITATVLGLNRSTGPPITDEPLFQRLPAVGQVVDSFQGRGDPDARPMNYAVRMLRVEGRSNYDVLKLSCQLQNPIVGDGIEGCLVPAQKRSWIFCCGSGLVWFDVPIIPQYPGTGPVRW